MVRIIHDIPSPTAGLHPFESSGRGSKTEAPGAADGGTTKRPPTSRPSGRGGRSRRGSRRSINTLVPGLKYLVSCRRVIVVLVPRLGIVGGGDVILKS